MLSPALILALQLAVALAAWPDPSRLGLSGASRPKVVPGSHGTADLPQQNFYASAGTSLLCSLLAAVTVLTAPGRKL